MRKARFLGSFTLVVALFAVAACSSSAGVEAPPAPTVPDHWTISSDVSFVPADIRPVAEALDANVTALRNTVYDVGGKRVQLNTIVAATSADADAVVAALVRVKPAEFAIRHDLIVYEFVGADDVLGEIRAARALLDRR